MDSSFINIRFPTDISYGAIGGPEFSTTVNINKSKGEYRNQNWIFPRRKYFIKYGVKTAIQANNVSVFFQLCCGMAKSFRYKDWFDYRAIKEIIGIGDATRVMFELSKLYDFNGMSVSRRITKPVLSTVALFSDGEPVLKDDFSVDSILGNVIFNTAPLEGVKITASFEFDVQVRFDKDFLPIVITDIDCCDINDIALIEVM